MAKSKKKSPLNLELLVLCDYALISKDNKLSIIGTFDQIFVEKIPARQGRMFVVGIINGEPNSVHSIKLSIKDPSGKEILKGQELKLKLSPVGRSNLVANLGNLPLASTGGYLVEISASGVVLGKRTLIVYRAGSRGRAKGASRYTN